MKTKAKGKLLAILMSLAMAFTMMLMVGGEAYADSNTEETINGVIYTLIVDENENRMVSVTGHDDSLGGAVEIAGAVEINGTEYPVTSIGDGAFRETAITSITIPASVTSIGDSAFGDCRSLASVTFAEGSDLESIGEWAFSETAITSITIPDRVKIIGGGAFKETAIQSITIPASVTSIEGGAFKRCQSLSSVTFAEGSELKSIGEEAFGGTSITSITIPEKVTGIEDSAFFGCPRLSSVTFAEGSELKSIGVVAFHGTAIQSVTIPESVTSIGGGAFADCYSLSSVTFAEGSELKSIGEAAFSATAITSITIPESVTSIGRAAFSATAITSITIPESVTSIGSGAFNFNERHPVFYMGTKAQWDEMSGRASNWAGGNTDQVRVFFVIKEPEGKSFTYNGETHTGVEAGTGYVLSGDISAANAGTYTATATPDGNHVWMNDYIERDPRMSMDDILSEFLNREMTISWEINKAVAEDKVAIPESGNFTYNGKEQSIIVDGAKYTLSGTVKATNAGTYKATATLNEDDNYIYEWTGGSTEPVEFTWKINKAPAKVTPPAGKKLTYNGKTQTGVAAGANYTLSGTVKATKAGTYTAKATLKTNANYTYKWSDGTTAPKTIKWTINKAANPLTIKAKTATVKYSKVKKKAQTLTVGKVITFTKKGQGKMTYTKASGNKKITINKTTGKVTVKKGLKKGTYKVKVKVKAAGNANYKASAVKTVTFKIKVK